MASDQSLPPPKVDTLANPQRRRTILEGGEGRAFLENFVSAAYRSGPDAQSEYERALADLRKVPEAIVIEIARALGKCEPYDYATRWALVFAACELKHKSALPLLASIVSTPLPQEPQPPSHGFSIVANETVLRTTAIEGLGHLAAQGHNSAIDSLFRVVREPSISLRRAGVQAILGIRKSAAMIERLRASLPPEQHFLLELKRPAVTEVPQVPKPQQYLSEEARERVSLTPPILPGQSQKQAPSRPPSRQKR